MNKIISFDLPQFTVQDSVIPTPDSGGVAYVVNDHPGYHVELNQIPFRIYDQIAGLTISPDSAKIAFAGMKNNKWFVICDNKEIGPYDDIGRTSPVFSPDSKRIAYTAFKSNKWYAGLDEKELAGPYEGFGPGGMVFSPDSEQIAYTVKQGGQWAAFLNGKYFNSFHGIIERSLIFSPDSKKFAFIACNPESRFFHNRMKAFLVINGEKGPLWDFEPKSGQNGIFSEIIFSPDSQHIAYAVLRDRKWSWIIDNEVQKGYNTFVSGRSGNPDWAQFPDYGKAICRPQTLSFSPDSNHYAYAARDSKRALLIYDGNETSQHTDILNTAIVFSPNSRHIAFGALENDQQYIMLDLHPLKKHWGLCGESSFSPDSSLLAYISIHDEKNQGFFLNVGNKHWSMPGAPLIGAHLVWDNNTMLHTVVFLNNRITKAVYHVH